jgi:hypothetical protein
MGEWEFASPRSSVDALVQLVDRLPWTRALYEDHLRENNEVLPHVLMADLRRMFVDMVEAGREDEVKRFLVEVEALVASSADSIRNLVDVSFIEDLVLGDLRETSALNKVRGLLGPATAAQLAATERFHRDPTPGEP